MSDSRQTFWDSLLELFRPFEVVAGVVGVVTTVLWFLSFPALILAIGGTIAFTLASVGIIGQVKHGRTEKFLSLGSLITGERKKKPRPRSNLVLIGIDHLNLYFDEKDTLWEVLHVPNPMPDNPSYCAVLRFANKPVAGTPGQPIKGLRASLTFRDPENGSEYTPIDRGAWVREEFNAFTLEVGDSRALVLARGCPPDDVPRNLNMERSRFIFGLENNHYSKDNYRRPVFRKLQEFVEVDVCLLAGNGGHILYEDTYLLQGNPHLELSLKPRPSD